MSQQGSNHSHVLQPTQMVSSSQVISSIVPAMNEISAQHQQAVPKVVPIPPLIPQSSEEVLTPPVVSRTRLGELVREVDAAEQLDDDVEEALLGMADDFIEEAVTAACRLARHRGAASVDVRDLHMYLERFCHLYIPGFGSDEPRPYKRAPTTEAHRQRLALIRKAVKKY